MSKSEDGDFFPRFIAVVLILGLLLMLKACSSDPAGAVQAAKDFGFTEAHVTEESWLWPGFIGCGGDDLVGYKLDALNSEGVPVRLVACNGYFKGVTVRVTHE